MDAAQSLALTARWGDAMLGYTEYLCQQGNTQQAELATTLTALELPNFFALLEQVKCAEGRGGDHRFGQIIVPVTAICRQAASARTRS
jgi:hypothetical protein